jgi:uncharacterized phage-like protein YoqJ
LILAITGHRPNKLGGYILPNPVSNEVMLKLADSLQTIRPTLVLTGMALGVDQWVAQLCAEMNIPFDAVIAFQGYEEKWPKNSQRTYYHLLSKARHKWILDPGPYRPSLMHHRNHWMVDKSEGLLAVWDGLPGSGTAACIEYAFSVNRPVCKINLPDHIWAMAREDATYQDERRQERQEASMRAEQERLRRNAAFVKSLEPQKPPKPAVQDAITYRRFIEVGEDES